MVAVTRISGIIYGVILTMIMSVLVFPKSASHQATDNLKAGLIKLAELNGVAWKKEEGCTALRDIMQPAKVSAESVNGLLPAYRDHLHDVETADGIAKPLLDEAADDCCDEVSCRVGYICMTGDRKARRRLV